MHIYHMVIYTKNNTNHYESTYAENNIFPIGKIFALQSRTKKNYAFLESSSLKWEN